MSARVLTFGGETPSAESITDFITTLPRPLVFTNGCFDILHRGHVSYLEEAAALGNSLLVGVNDDASVRGLDKGPERPINTLEDRMAVLAALRCVDGVLPFSDPTPIKLILAARPDVLVKGGDWSPDDIVGAEEVRARGGSVHSIPFRFDRSTSQVVDKIRRSLASN